MFRCAGAEFPWVRNRNAATGRGDGRPVYAAMGYIIGIIVLILLLPLLWMMLTRRTTGHGGIDSDNHGVTPDRPSSDEPTPRPGPGVDRKIPPG